MANRKGGFIGYDGLNAPDAPTNITGTAGDQEIEIAFTAPSDVGGAAIDTYIAVAINTSTEVSSSNTGASSPITVSSLTNDVAHSITVYAQNGFGASIAGTGDNVTPATPDTGLFGGGSGASTVNIIDFISISTTGNATDFGDLTQGDGCEQGAACASSTRGVWTAGSITGLTLSNAIQYVTIATTGNSIDFGDLTVTRINNPGCSNQTRGLFGGGLDSSINYLNVIDYITIASTGNTTNFGDLTTGRRGAGSASSTIRGIWAGGNTGSNTNIIDYATIASTGNAIDFGDLTTSRYLNCGVSSSTRAVFSAGNPQTNTIDYVTIASTGNATDFGDLLNNFSEGIMGVSNKTRGVFGGGANGPHQNVIQYITIASTGNASDFGDLTAARSLGAGCSDCHGGLS